MVKAVTDTQEEVDSAPSQGWNARLRHVVGTTGAAARAPALTVRTVVALLGLLAVWRLSILAVSFLWGRLFIRYPWPPEIDVMLLWRYSVRWDSGFYLSIAEQGYENVPDSQAFFPLFPLLIRIVDQLMPGLTVLAALVVVHLALFGAILYIYQIVRLDFSERVAWRTISCSSSRAPSSSRLSTPRCCCSSAWPRPPTTRGVAMILTTFGTAIESWIRRRPCCADRAPVGIC